MDIGFTDKCWYEPVAQYPKYAKGLNSTIYHDITIEDLYQAFKTRYNSEIPAVKKEEISDSKSEELENVSKEYKGIVGALGSGEEVA